MIVEDINCIKKYLSKGKSLKVCILDNNSIDFLTRVNASIRPEQVFSQYDMDKDKIDAFVKSNRQIRRIKFTRKKQDNSV